MAALKGGSSGGASGGVGRVIGRALARLGQIGATLLALSFLLFGVMEQLPGDPVDLLVTSNPNVHPDDVARLKRLRGLDRPWPVRWWRWLVGHPEAFAPPRAPVLPLVVGELAGEGVFPLEIALPATQGLVLEALGDTRIEGGTLRATLRRPGVHSIPFLVRAAESGLESVGTVEVLVAPPDPRAVVAPDGPIVLDDDQRQLGASPEHVEGLGQRSEQELAQAARDAGRATPPPPRVQSAAPDGSLDLALAELGVGPGARPLRGAFEVANERVRARFAGPGQSVLALAVPLVDPLVDAGQGTVTLAFAVDHGPKPSSKWVRGAIFVLLGEREALGWSATWKRPVWELLFGPQCQGSCGDDASARTAGAIQRFGRVQNTLALVLPAFLLSLLLAVPLGALSAWRRDGFLDRAVGALSLVGLSVPAFWLGMLGIAGLAAGLQWLPAGGIQTPGLRAELGAVLADRAWHSVLPTLVLTLVYASQWIRYVRAGVLEALPLDFVRTARAKGLAPVGVLRHALRSALLPLVTVVALATPQLFAGALLTETVFAWPGVGRLQYEAVLNNDSYVAIVVFLVSALLVMLANLAADLAYRLLDPRLRRPEGP